MRRMKHYRCNRCGYRWRKGGFSILPKCPSCGSHSVVELKLPKREEYESIESTDVDIGDQGQGI